MSFTTRLTEWFDPEPDTGEDLIGDADDRRGYEGY